MHFIAGPMEWRVNQMSSSTEPRPLLKDGTIVSGEFFTAPALEVLHAKTNGPVAEILAAKMQSAAVASTSGCHHQ